jgi:adenylate cyclase
VLEGSVRRAGGRVRITGQLIEAATGAHLWADRVDGALEDVFELQDEVTTRVVGAVEPSITEAGITRACVKPTSSLEAYDLYLKALSIHYSHTRRDVDEALRLLEQAIALDPSYSCAKAFAAYIYVFAIQSRLGDLTRGLALAREALLYNRDEPNTIAFAAHVLAWLGKEHDAALVAMDRAIQLNPNAANILVRSGWMRNWIADADRAIDHFSGSIRLNPVDPLIGYAHGGLASAYLLKGEYEKAMEYTRRTTHELPRWIAGWLGLAIAASHVGNQQEANAAKDRLLELIPNFSIAYRHATAVFRDQWVNDRFEHGLRLAGVPES